MDFLILFVAIFVALGHKVYGELARSYQTAPCPNYALSKRAIKVDGAVLRSSGELHGDCRITFQVPNPETQRFLLRFEAANIRECHDRLTIYDSDDVADSTRIHELSCRSQPDPTRFLYTGNAAGFVTIRYYTYNKGEAASDFQLVLTAVGKPHKLGACKFQCANGHCISAERMANITITQRITQVSTTMADLKCDALRVNHCGDNSDEQNCGKTDADEEQDASDKLGLSITVTIIISLSVLFVCGVCVCSIALFVCKRNEVPLPSDAPVRAHPEILTSSEATTSGCHSPTPYSPVLTDHFTYTNGTSGKMTAEHDKKKTGVRRPYNSTIVQVYPPETDSTDASLTSFIPKAQFPNQPTPDHRATPRFRGP